MREKLIELLNDCQAKGFWSYGTDCKTGERGGHEMTAEDIADYLVENITSKWIPVKDRLPEENKRVLGTKIGADKRFVFWGKYHNKQWIDLEWSCYRYGVTHWMPLPEPPKGE